MKTIQRTLIVAASFILALGLATSAIAGSNCDNKPADHPCHTTTTTSSTTTTSTTPALGDSCVASADQGHQVFTESDGFEIVVLPGTVGCVDWTTADEAEWLVTVDPGDAKSVSFSVRGSHPGDFCWRGWLDVQDIRNGLRTVTITHSEGPLADGLLLPISTVGACGDWDDNVASFVFTVGSSGKASPVAVTVSPR
jgi:hypothetical protein